MAAPDDAPLPDFLVVGAAKAGTSTLWRHLASHPGIFMTPSKEPHFFDVHFAEGEAWYRKHFAGAGAGQRVGEATSQYLWEPLAAERMAAMLPDAQLVVTLRDPVDRAYSHFWMRESKFPDGAEFGAVVREELSGDIGDRPYHGPYLAMGCYLGQLERLCAHFPRESVLVLLFEDLRDEPARTVADVYHFLAVDEAFRPAGLGQAENVTSTVRSQVLRRAMLRRRAWRRAPRLANVLERLNRRGPGYPPMDAGLRTELAAWYAPHNAALSEWLGRQLPWA